MNHLLAKLNGTLSLNSYTEVLNKGKGKEVVNERQVTKNVTNDPGWSHFTNRSKLNVPKYFNHHWFSVTLIDKYNSKLHRSDSSYHKKFMDMMDEFSELDHIDQCNVFLSTRLGRKPEDGIKHIGYGSNGLMSFYLDDLINLWIEMIRAGFDPFDGYVNKENNQFTYPIEIMAEYDLPQFKKDPGFSDLINEIFQQYKPADVYFYDKTYKKSLLLILCNQIVRINCLKTLINIMQEHNIKYSEYITRYVNYEDENGKNCLHTILSTNTTETYWFDSFVNLIKCGARIDTVVEGWNVVSRCFTNIKTLEYLLNEGHRPTLQYVPHEFAMIRYQNNTHPNKQLPWTLQNLTPQLYVIHTLALQVQAKERASNENKDILQKIIDEKVLKVLEMLKLYDIYNITDYGKKSKLGYTIIDYAKRIGNEELLEYVESKL